MFFRMSSRSKSAQSTELPAAGSEMKRSVSATLSTSEQEETCKTPVNKIELVVVLRNSRVRVRIRRVKTGNEKCKKKLNFDKSV